MRDVFAIVKFLYVTRLTQCSATYYTACDTDIYRQFFSNRVTETLQPCYTIVHLFKHGFGYSAGATLAPEFSNITRRQSFVFSPS